jgi:hypothetical protein
MAGPELDREAVILNAPTTDTSQIGQSTRNAVTSVRVSSKGARSRRAARDAAIETRVATMARTAKHQPATRGTFEIAGEGGKSEFPPRSLRISPVTASSSRFLSVSGLAIGASLSVFRTRFSPPTMARNDDATARKPSPSPEDLGIRSAASSRVYTERLERVDGRERSRVEKGVGA